MKRVFAVVAAAIALVGFLPAANASIVRVSYTGTAQGEIDHSVLLTGSTFQMLLDFASSTSDPSGISGLAVPRLYLNGAQLTIPGASAISYASALSNFSFNAYTTTNYPLPPTEENPLIQANVSHFLIFYAPIELVPGPGASFPYFASTTPCPCSFFTKDTTDHYATFINGEWVNEYTMWDTPTSVNLQVATLSIAAVPEPSTWALMLLGFAGVRFFYPAIAQARNGTSIAAGSDAAEDAPCRLRDCGRRDDPKRKRPPGPAGASQIRTTRGEAGSDRGRSGGIGRADLSSGQATGVFLSA